MNIQVSAVSQPPGTHLALSVYQQGGFMSMKQGFLSNLVAVAILSSQFPASLWAQVHYYGHGGGFINDNASGASWRSQQRQLFSDLEKSPTAAMDHLVNYLNDIELNPGLGFNAIVYKVKYVTNLPEGLMSRYEMLRLNDNQLVMQLTLHESAKTNPFVLLDALIQLKNVYEINSIMADVELTHWHPHHATHLTKTLNSVLGLPMNETLNPHGQADAGAYRDLSPIELVEVLNNAKAGSVIAQRKLAEIEAENFVLIKRGFESFKEIQKLNPEQKKAALVEYMKIKGFTPGSEKNYSEIVKKFIDSADLKIKQRLDGLNARATQEYKKQIAEYKNGSEVRKALAEGPALNDMIKANDREGVALAMEKMLPWSLMEPSEKSFWTDFVEAIRHPDYKNAEILFRGIDGDEKFQGITDKTGNIIGGGVLSKRLTAGSGSHFLKLQGLPETFETFGTYGVNFSKRISPLSQPHLLSRMMVNHATNPSGSPFISLSFSLDVAYSFSKGNIPEAKDPEDFKKQLAKSLKTNASGGLATVRIDPRRLLTNSVSAFASEIEVLASMFIFPDEVLYFEKGVKINGQIGSNFFQEERVTAEDYYKRARQAVYQKTGMNLPVKHQDLAESGSKAFMRGFIDLNARFEKVSLSGQNRCEGVFR